MMPLFKRMMSGDRQQEYFHSSGYAQAQNGSGMGAVSAQSFQERKAIEDRRKFVQGYRNARLVGEGFLRERIKSQASNMVEGGSERSVAGARSEASGRVGAGEASGGRAGVRGGGEGKAGMGAGGGASVSTGNRGGFQYRPDFGRKS